jgi:hypothetical protein
VTPIVVLTLASSVFALLFNVVQRIFYYLAYRSKKRFTKERYAESIAEASADSYRRHLQMSAADPPLLPRRISIARDQSGARLGAYGSHSSAAGTGSAIELGMYPTASGKY